MAAPNISNEEKTLYSFNSEEIAQIRYRLSADEYARMITLANKYPSQFSELKDNATVATSFSDMIVRGSSETIKELTEMHGLMDKGHLLFIYKRDKKVGGKRRRSSSRRRNRKFRSTRRRR